MLTVGDKTSESEKCNHPLGRPEFDPFCGGFRSDVYDVADPDAFLTHPCKSS